jgi:hypothetical protein
VLRIPLTAVEACGVTNCVFAVNLREEPAIRFNVSPKTDEDLVNIWVHKFLEKAGAV